MKSSGRRLEKYRKKIRAAIIPGQASRFGGALPGQLQIERSVRTILTRNGVFPGFNHFYMAFAKKVLQLAGRWTGQTLYDEVVALEVHWERRGLVVSVLDEIKLLFGIVVPHYFRLDISLLDGGDVLS